VRRSDTVTRRGPGLRRRAAVAVMMAVVLSACGGEEGVDPELTSGPTDPFEIVEHGGDRYVVGHGVALEMGPGWTDYEDEREGTDGTTYEWAVGLPVEGVTFPSGLQFSMGKPGAGPHLETLPATHRELAALSKGYEFVDEGKADVPGAERAAFLRFVRDFDYKGERVRLEQVTLMIETRDDTTSTIRFLAPKGKWEEQMQEVYDSVVVTGPEDA
jgi:hypothetical protein